MYANPSRCASASATTPAGTTLAKSGNAVGLDMVFFQGVVAHLKRHAAGGKLVELFAQIALADEGINTRAVDDDTDLGVRIIARQVVQIAECSRPVVGLIYMKYQ